MIDLSIFLGVAFTYPGQDARIVKDKITSYRPGVSGMEPSTKYTIVFTLSNGATVEWVFDIESVRNSVLEKLDKEMNTKSLGE